jgi:hypothetical protein
MPGFGLFVVVAGMSNGSMKRTQYRRSIYRGIVAALVTTGSSLGQCWFSQPATAQTKAYCQFPQDAIAQKDSLRLTALKGNSDAQNSYKAVIKQHSERLRQCRSQTWPRIQAIWLRLHPCDARPGALDEVFDRLVNLGYNQVYLEVFYDGQVLLPASENSTPWPSVLRTPGSEKVDLLAQALQKGRERGMRVYTWMFAMNFGYSYAQRYDRKSALARDGKGNISLDVVDDGSQVFIDPYNRQAKADYYQMVQALVRRRPDGVLFDYIRYPRQGGADSIANDVKDLWIYGEGAQQALFERAQNSKGLELIRRFVSQGYINTGDIQAVDKLYPQEGSPLWQGRNPPADELKISAAKRRPSLQWELWQLTVAHAAQGVVDFLALASTPAQQLGIPTGSVFFPEGNQAIGQGYDSRVQPWNRFASTREWHPMSYALCGNSSSCIAAQVQRVLTDAPPGTLVIPALAGVWGKSYKERPPLEAQMQAVREVAPQLNGVSHFAYSWQEPEYDRDRKSCSAR